MVSGTPDPEAQEALRVATLATRPVMAAQLGEKLRIVTMVGVHRIVRRSFPEHGLKARWLVSLARRFHQDLPGWFYLDAVGFDPEEAARTPRTSAGQTATSPAS